MYSHFLVILLLFGSSVKFAALQRHCPGFAESLKQQLPGLLGLSMSVPEQRQWSGCFRFAEQQLPGLAVSSMVVPLQRHCPRLLVSSKQQLRP